MTILDDNCSHWIFNESICKAQLVAFVDIRPTACFTVYTEPQTKVSMVAHSQYLNCGHWFK